MKHREQHLDLVEQKDLDWLMQTNEWPVVSLFMPTHRDSTEIPQDALRYKNLLDRAEKELTENGLRRAEAQKRIEPLRRYEDDTPFWTYQGDGLAVYIGADTHRLYRLPIRLTERVAVDERFIVTPLLPLLEMDGRFYVLALDQGGVRLLRGTRFGMDEVALRDIPTSLADIWSRYDFEPSQQFQTGTATPDNPRDANYHGHGGAADDANVKTRIREFFSELNQGVCDLLSNEDAPLMLAGVDALRGLYRQENSYRHLLETAITHNPTPMKSAELHKMAWEKVRPEFEGDRARAREEYARLAGNDRKRVSADPQRVIPAASNKRVQTLFVDAEASLWGHFDESDQRVEMHDAPRNSDMDLINLAVVNTLKGGGDVHVSEAASIPGGGTLAAILRY